MTVTPSGYRIWRLPVVSTEGPPRLRSGQAPSRVERPSLGDEPLFVERRSLHSALSLPRGIRGALRSRRRKPPHAIALPLEGRQLNAYGNEVFAKAVARRPRTPTRGMTPP